MVVAVLGIRSSDLWRYHSYLHCDTQLFFEHTYSCVQITFILLDNGPKAQE